MSKSGKGVEQKGFDPYHRWLAIPPGQRPPTHYQLLGISPDETDVEVIHAAALRQSAYVRNFQAGQHADEASRVLSELAEARAVLTDAARRKEYDARLGPQAAHEKRSNQLVTVEPLRERPSEARRLREVRRLRRAGSWLVPVVVGVGLLAATGSMAAIALVLWRVLPPKQQPGPARVALPPAKRPLARVTPALTKSKVVELPLTVKPAHAAITVLSGGATVAGQGESRRLVLRDQAANAEVALRVEAKGYEAATRTLALGRFPAAAPEVVELVPIRNWLRDLPVKKWQAACPKVGQGEHSFSMHPPQRAEGHAATVYDIPGYRTFHSRVTLLQSAVQDSFSPVTFAVFGDGKLLWASGPIQKRGESEECVCDVTGVIRLELRVRCAGQQTWAWGAWIDPYLVECDAFVAEARKARDKRPPPENVQEASFWGPEARSEAAPPTARTDPQQRLEDAVAGPGRWQLIPGGDFEAATDAWEDQYPGLAKGTFSLSMEQAFDGKQSACLVPRQDMPDGGFAWISQPVDLTPGQEYVLSAAFQTRDMASGMLYVQVDGSSLTRIDAIANRQQWQFVWVKFTAVASRVRVRLVRDGFAGEVSKSGEPGFIDCVAITPREAFTPPKANGTDR